MPIEFGRTTGRAPERWTHAAERLAVEVLVQKNVGSVGHITPILASSCDRCHSAYLFGRASFNCTQFSRNAFSVPVGAILPRSKFGRTAHSLQAATGSPEKEWPTGYGTSCTNTENDPLFRRRG